jgi:hypothetical protein
MEQGDSHVSIRITKRRSAVVALAATAVMAGGVAAYGYPNGTEMTVSATAGPTDPAGGTSITVTVSNANPACQIRVRIDNDNEQILPVSGTSATTTIVVAPAIEGRHTVRARTVNCTEGADKEHAKSRFVVEDAMVTGPANADLGKYYRLTISGLEPGTPVSLVATAPDGSPSVGPAQDDVANNRGEAKLRVRLTEAGTWSVVVSAQPSGMPSTVIGELHPVVG